MRELSRMMRSSDVHSVSINPTQPGQLPAVAFLSAADDSGQLQFDFTNTNNSNLRRHHGVAGGQLRLRRPQQHRHHQRSDGRHRLRLQPGRLIKWQRYIVFSGVRSLGCPPGSDQYWAGSSPPASVRSGIFLVNLPVGLGVACRCSLADG